MRRAIAIRADCSTFVSVLALAGRPPDNFCAEAIMSVGCFGNHPEDRYFSRQLDRHLDAQDAHATMIDRRANDIYRAKLESLPVCYRTTSFGTRMLNLDDVIGDILFGASDDGVALACAVRDGNSEEVGRLLIKLLTNKLRDDARDEAEGEA